MRTHQPRKEEDEGLHKRCAIWKSCRNGLLGRFACQFGVDFLKCFRRDDIMHKSLIPANRAGSISASKVGFQKRVPAPRDSSTVGSLLGSR